MARARSIFRCSDCGSEAAKWVGRCSACGAWNTLVEEVVASRVAPVAGGGRDPVPVTEVAQDGRATLATGLAEVDRVLGGGLVPGSVTLVGGEPGIGKSTLLLQLAGGVARSGVRALFDSAEETPEQVRRRAERLGALTDELWLGDETDVAALVDQLDRVQPGLLVVDSIQTVHDPDLSGVPGSVGQVRECAARLALEAKRRGIATVLVGHVTKEGSLAGPRVLEHLVDTVVAVEGDRHHGLRLVRAVKHRFGPTGELGVLEMTGSGLATVPDPSGRFLADRRPGVSGSVVAAAMEGHRPLLLEVQALVAPGSSLPRRTVHGLQPGRLAVVLAVLERRLRWPMGGFDVHALAVGGAKLHEPGADLAAALAIASSYADVPVPDQIVVCGEVGLGGEVRQVARCEQRLAEAARLGFRTAVVPAAAPEMDLPLRTIRVATVADAVAELGLATPADYRAIIGGWPGTGGQVG